MFSENTLGLFVFFTKTVCLTICTLKNKRVKIKGEFHSGTGGEQLTGGQCVGPDEEDLMITRVE